MRRRSQMTSGHSDRALLPVVSRVRLQQQQKQRQQSCRRAFVVECLLLLLLLCIQCSTTVLALLSESLPDIQRHKTRQRSLLRTTLSKFQQQYQQDHWQRHLPQVSDHRQIQGNSSNDNDNDDNDDRNRMTIIGQYFGSCILLLGKYDADRNSIINYTEFYNIVHHVCDTASTAAAAITTSNTTNSSASAVIPSTNSTSSATSISIWDDIFHIAACTCQLYDDNVNSSSDCCSNRTTDDVIYRPGKYSSNYTYSICNHLYSNFIQYDCIDNNEDNNEPVTTAPIVLFPTAPTSGPNLQQEDNNGEYNDNQNTTTNDVVPTTTTTIDSNNMESWMIALLTLLSVSVVSMVLYIKVSNGRDSGDNNHKNRKSTRHHNDDTDSTTGIAVEAIAKGSIVPAAPSSSKSKKTNISKRKYDTTKSGQTTTKTAVIKKKKKKNTTNTNSCCDGIDGNIIGIAPPTYCRIDDDETDESTQHHRHDDEEVMIVLVNTNKTASSEEDNDDDDDEDENCDDRDGNGNGGVSNVNRNKKRNGIPTVVVNKDTQNHETNPHTTKPQGGEIVNGPASTSSADANNDRQKQQQHSMTYKNYEQYFHDTTSSSSSGGLMHLANTNDLMYSGSYQYFNTNTSHNRSVSGNKHPATMNTITEVLNDSSSSSSTSDDHTTSSDHDNATRMDPLNNVDNNNDDVVDGSSSSDCSTSSESSTTTSSSSSTSNDNNNSNMNAVTSSGNSLKLSSRQQLNAIHSTETARSEDESESSSSSASMSSAGVVSNTSSMIPLLSDPLLLPKLQPTILDRGIDNTSLSSKRSRPTSITTTTTADTVLSSNQTTPPLPASLHKQPLLESKSLISSSSLLYRNLQRSVHDYNDDYYNLNIDTASNIEINNIYESDDDDIQQLLSLNARENHDGMDFACILPAGVNSSNSSNLITNVTSLGSGNTPTGISPSNEEYNVVSFTTAQQRQLFQKQGNSMNNSFEDCTDDDGSTIVATNPRALSNIVASRKQPPFNDRLENEGEKNKKDLTPKTANTKVMDI